MTEVEAAVRAIGQSNSGRPALSGVLESQNR